MGVNHLVMPLDAPALEWAEKCGVPVGGVVAAGRRATLEELTEAVAEIPGHSFKTNRFGDEFDIWLESEERVTFPCDTPCRNMVAPGLAEGPAAWANIRGSARPTGAIEWMSFQGDMELLIATVRRLTTTCGPQLFFADFDGIPWLILSADAVPIGPEPADRPSPDF